jgi:hypothetical protein
MILCPAWVSNVRRRRIVFPVFLQVPICEEEKVPCSYFNLSVKMLYAFSLCFLNMRKIIYPVVDPGCEEEYLPCG